MPEPTKKRPTDRTVNIAFKGPEKNRLKVIEAVQEFGFKDIGDSIPWRGAFLDHDEEQEPGICLLGARQKEGLTQEQVADITGIPQRHISEMENGKRAIGKERAKILGKALDISYRVFL
jgi:DNA-binding XRE family transcriptional regulator